jgi:hypothetical protein
MILGWLAAECARHRWPVAALAILLALGSVWAVHTRLGVSTDTGALFPSSLPWKQRAAVLQRAFPQNEELLVAVIDARQPDASPYLERNAFLFLDARKLRDLLDRTTDIRPLLGSLSADPTLRGLCAALSLLAQGVEAGQADLAPFLPALLALFRPALGAGEAGLRTAAPLDGLLVRARWPAFAVLGVLGAILLPSLTFDSDPLQTKNRDSEAILGGVTACGRWTSSGQIIASFKATSSQSGSRLAA